MKVTKLFITLLTLSLPFYSFSQDLITYSDNTPNITKRTYTSKQSIQDQEYKLTSQLNHYLAEIIEYPFEARENGDEGMLRAVVLIDSDHSNATLKIVDGNAKSLETALIEAYNKLNIRNFISDSYQGQTAIPIKISFELE